MENKPVENLEASGPTNLIFDDSNDLHRSLSFADGMITDASSLVPLFQVTGKPILFQNINLIDDSDFYSQLIVDSFAICCGRMWFYHYFLNILIEIDVKDFSVIGAVVVDVPKYRDQHLFRGIYSINERLYLAPDYADSILEYDTVTKEIRTYKISINDTEDARTTSKFSKIIRWQDKLFFVPNRFSSIVVFDSVTHKIEYCNSYYKILKYKRKSVKAWFVGACINDNELILPCRFSNDIVVFDLATLEVNICSIADEQTFFSWCCYANGYYWVAGCSGDIYKWSKADSVWYKVYSACSAVHSAWTTGFEYNGYVWVFGQYFDEVLRINPKTDDVEVVYELLSNYKYDKTISNPFFRINWLFAEPFDSGIVAFRLKSRELVIFDPETEKVESHGIKLSSIENEKIKNELYKVSILSNPIIEVSGGLFNLSDFLKYLSLNIKSDSENIAQESDGKLIFEYVKEIMLSG